MKTLTITRSKTAAHVKLQRAAIRASHGIHIKKSAGFYTLNGTVSVSQFGLHDNTGDWLVRQDLRKAKHYQNTPDSFITQLKMLVG